MSWSFLPVAESGIASANLVWFDPAEALLILVAAVALCALAILGARALAGLEAPVVVWPRPPRKRREMRLRTAAARHLT